MNYQETVDWMFRQLPMYQRQGRTAFKKDLHNTIKLADYLGNPEKDFKSVHVGGTNGKGSTSHILASILHEAGYRVGLYTSPHLKSFRERIRINGEEVDEEFVVNFVEAHKNYLEDNSLSFFEMTVGMAFQYFSVNRVDIAIIEVGLGGRLDSTNIIIPEVSVITNIGFDHVQFLGNTYEAIAIEKAGIIKKNVPVVIGETHPKTKVVFEDKSNEQQTEIYFADQLIHENLESDLKGIYQKYNVKTALQTINILKNRNFNVTGEDIGIGLNNVSRNTGLKGRWQILGTRPKIICDTGHNREALVYIFNQLRTEAFDTLHIVFGVVNDKDVSVILPIMPKNAIYYFCKPDIPRGMESKKLQSIFQSEGFEGEAYKSVDKALVAAKKRASKRDLIFIGGSTFVVAEIIE